MTQTLIQQLRSERPLIHNITNAVVMNYTANGLLALGASPIMSNAVQEAGDVARLADGLLLNIGTLNEHQVEAMLEAGKAANEAGVPVVLDPVGVAATSYRAEACRKILSTVNVDVIKGNAGELAFLAGEKVETKGVDSGEASNTEEIVLKVSEVYQTMAVCTGKTDVVGYNGQIFKNNTGHEWLSKVTGSGCLLGAVLTAFLSLPGDRVVNVQTGLYYFGKAAEHAASLPHVSGSGTFVPAFIDALGAEEEVDR